MAGLGGTYNPATSPANTGSFAELRGDPYGTTPIRQTGPAASGGISTGLPAGLSSLLGGGTPSQSFSPGSSVPGNGGSAASPAAGASGLSSLFAGGGAASPASGAGYAPQNFTSNVQENPQLAALRGQYAQYQSGLASGNDIDARNAMGRQRDLASGYAKEGLSGALDKGFGSDSGVAQKARLSSLSAGQTASGALNAGLTSDARKQQLDALQGRTSLEGTQAGITQGQQNFALSSWQANQQSQQAAAQLAAMQQQNSFNNQLNVLNTLSNFYTGF